MKMFVIFNHTLTKEQEDEASERLRVDQIIVPPENLVELWAHIPPEPESLSDLLGPFMRWLSDNCMAGDYALVQGEFGATCLMVKYAVQLGLKPIYSTTRRKAVEEVLVDNEVRISHRLDMCVFVLMRFESYV